MKTIRLLFFIVIAMSLFNYSNADDKLPFPVSLPEEQNIDANILADLRMRMSEGKYGKVHSVLIVRNGYLCFEKYYNGYKRDRKHRLASITKTFTSAVIGIAIDQGKIKSVDEHLLDFFPDYSNISHYDSLQKTVTLKHLLTMTAGFDAEDSVWASLDWVKFMLTRRIKHLSGTVWEYSNGSSMLLSGIIQVQMGQSVEEIAKQYIFSPLNISDWHWDKGPNGLTATAGGLYLRPIDMALFGQLYLQEGIWRGKQLISKEWIDESRKVYVKHAKADRSYGYHLWHYIPESAVAKMLKINDIYFASGAGNQKLFIVPHLSCVIVMTGDRASTKEMLPIIITAIKN